MNSNSLAAAHSFRFRPGRILASLFLGAALGLSVYNYFLIRVFPPASKRSLLLLAGLVLAGAFGYFVLLDRWIIPRLIGLKPVQRALMIGFAALLGGFLMLAGTGAIKASPGSTILLLPGRTVQISVPESQLVSDPEVVLLYFKTSNGGIPFTEMDYRGWTLRGNQLVLSDFSNNSLRWTGRPGQQASFIFQRSPRGGYIDVDWGGFTETVNLHFERAGKYLYEHEYPVPIYASGAVVLLLLAVNFIAAACALLLFLWQRRSLLMPALAASLAPVGHLSPDRSRQVVSAQGWKFMGSQWLWIIGIMLVAFLLRVLYLGRPYLYIDEFTHLIAARELLAGTPLSSVYQRGLLIVTLPVALFVQLFGFHIWAAKLPGVILNVMAIIPLYLMMGKIHKKAAIFSCILFAISPWIIAVSRSIREYAYYPFYFYWICLAMILFLERVPVGLVITRDWKKLANLQNALLALVLILPILYAFPIDPLSTFKIIAVLYLVFLIFLAARITFADRSNLLLLAAAALGLGILAFSLLPRLMFFDLMPDFNIYPLRYFFPNPEQQWFFGRPGLLFAFAFASAILAGVVFYRRNFIPLFIGVAFLASLLGFFLFFSRFIRPRYLLNVQFWFVPLIGLGLYMLWSALRALFSGKQVPLWTGALVLAALSVNGTQVLAASFYDKPGVMPITDEYQYNFQAVEDFLLPEIKPGDVLVGSFYAAYASWVERPAMEIYSLGGRREQEAQDYIFGIIEQFDSGWLILDDRYDRGDWPVVPFEREGRTIEYIGSFGDQLVWKWYPRR